MDKPRQPAVKLVYAAIFGWIAISVILTFHLRVFYEIEWQNSLKWGIGDSFLWVVWLGVCSAAYRPIVKNIARTLRLPTLGVLALFSATFLHPMSTVLLFWFIDGSIAHPFWDQVTFLASKKLPEGILAGLVIFYLCRLMHERIFGKMQREQSNDAVARSAEWMLLENRTGAHKVMIERISYCETAGNYVELVTDDGRFIKRATLKALAEDLRDQSFVRISRSHLVNLARVISLHQNGTRSASLKLDSGKTLIISRRFTTSVRQVFESDGY